MKTAHTVLPEERKIGYPQLQSASHVLVVKYSQEIQWEVLVDDIEGEWKIQNSSGGDGDGSGTQAEHVLPNHRVNRKMEPKQEQIEELVLQQGSGDALH
jgi:hypothetical protein